MTAPNEASAAQIQAARPGFSTWLSANAGSGKTRVLTDRVARLLLRDVPPQNILCLTFTKAAAAEMQNRLFARLGSWSMLDDHALGEALISVGEDTPGAERLAKARRLFARAIETPGGLKIQTIHSFCSAILRRFPLEAGVPPGFTELDDTSAKARLQEALDHVARTAPQVFDTFAALFSGLEIEGFCRKLAGQREAFTDPADFETISAQLGLPPGFSEARLLGDVFVGGEDDLLTALIPLLLAGSSADAKAGDEFSELPADRMSALAVLDKRLVGQSGKSAGAPKIGSFPTKATREAMPADLLADLEALMERVAEAHDRAKQLRLAQRSHALHAFAQAFLPAYDAAKAQRGELDFDDLIFKTRDLLSREGVADWVLFRLDGGIDHILVDEAQDTGPAQWQVIDLISREITSGSGRREAGERTIFVVGDKKQSIYGFQGADPDGFERMADTFTDRLGQSGEAPQRMELQYSFRSAAPVLRVVDEAFPNDPRAMGGALTHIAFHEDMPGRVDLWPFIPKPEKTEDDTPWFNPVDMVSEDDPQVQLAERIAQEILRMKAEERLFEAVDGSYQTRRIIDGDILILVQRRKLIFHEVIRACKAAGLHVAGADRVRLTDAMAVKDLLALLAFLDMPDDDLSLAAALRSPLFDWSEDALYRLAQPRLGTLWQALRDHGPEGDTTRAILTDLRNSAGFLRPYELLERILTHHQGRPRLLARLGEESEESIDLLLSTALSYEQAETPSLSGFLSWMESSEIDIKRGQESGGRAIRVMTVHGAKGLEAPIVILAESGDRQPPREDGAVLLDGFPPLWKPSKPDTPADILPLFDALKEKQEEERLRLQYVAMTRAEQWLIVCGAGAAKEDKENWYRRTEGALERVGAVHHLFPFGSGQRYENARPAEQETVPVRPVSDETVTLPAVALTPAAVPARPAQILSPSSLPGPKTLPTEGEGNPDAMARGTTLHLLLEFLPGLPPSAREAHAAALVQAHDPLTDPETVAEALAVLSEPALASLFSGSALVEVPISAHLPELGGQPMQGVIDRLIVTETTVTAIDYKSNVIVPDDLASIPSGLLAQMGAYASALVQIYPAHKVQTALLWTRIPRLDILPHDLVTNALKATASA
ncbi:double-strand break repair helicase AddA [Oceanicola sp. 502str15]|uniref:double-strand break repair helicase AddA n=1 Tax=Oceanicola sp. 502str15 TaxID=2696061 RepID=UPI00209458B2|nr:double-strand break repair helicase AddA [Oceanicola sp. 502str15]MCO6384172.1 double-strand break repair helicase AddA [Oceanicola sp. 502str15]